MKERTTSEIAALWGMDPRYVRKLCAEGSVSSARRTSRGWLIPESAEPPQQNTRSLLQVLREEKDAQLRGGIYHKVQIELTYNSNHMEGSSLTQEQTRYIYETHTIGAESSAALNVNDIVETANHFRCIDRVIECADQTLRESFIRELHLILKNGTADSRKDWFAVGAYKKLPNEVGGMETTAPEDVPAAMRSLLRDYNRKRRKTWGEIIAFHAAFEAIHPFQDGNGRVGRLILFKECLRNEIVPFIIGEDHKWYYLRGLREWKRTPGYLLETCRSAQDRFKQYLDYFRIPYRADD